MDELAEKLLVKFKFSEEMTQAAVEEVRGFSRLIEISGILKVIPDNPDENMVVECAVIGHATHIVTGDKHLLSLKKHQNIAILTATEFIACCHYSRVLSAAQPRCTGTNSDYLKIRRLSTSGERER